jgi:hypothetical protein
MRCFGPKSRAFLLTYPVIVANEYSGAEGFAAPQQSPPRQPAPVPASISVSRLNVVGLACLGIDPQASVGVPASVCVSDMNEVPARRQSLRRVGVYQEYDCDRNVVSPQSIFSTHGLESVLNRWFCMIPR